jgi:hypothetical protein
MEAAGSPAMSGRFYQTTRRQIPEDWNANIHKFYNIKSPTSGGHGACRLGSQYSIIHLFKSDDLASKMFCWCSTLKMEGLCSFETSAHIWLHDEMSQTMAKHKHDTSFRYVTNEDRVSYPASGSNRSPKPAFCTTTVVGTQIASYLTRMLTFTHYRSDVYDLRILRWWLWTMLFSLSYWWWRH